MVDDDVIADIPATMGVGRIQISNYPIVLPLFFINFGKDQPSLAGQFKEYDRITLTIDEVDPFTFRFDIHSDILLYTLTKEMIERIDNGEEMKAVLSEYPGVYSFHVTEDIKRHWHTIFADARNETEGVWVLLLHGKTSNFILIDDDGQILERKEMPRRKLPYIED